MTTLRYTEVLGTAGADSLTGSSQKLLIGSSGNDTLTSGTSSEEVYLYGGGGADTYIISAGSGTIVNDGLSSGGDSLSASFGLNSAVTTYTIDSKHLLVSDGASNTSFIIINWLNSVNQIETITFNGTSYSPTSLNSALSSATNFQGNISLANDESGIFPEFNTADEINEMLDYNIFRDFQVKSSVDSNNHDSIVGGDSADLFYGFDGNDTIRGNSGNDTIRGNSGEDSIKGGAGVDDIRGGAGADFINGNAGADIIRGNKGDDIIRGGQGSDNVHAGQDNDFINGNKDGDSVYGDKGNDTVKGGQGDDYVSGGNGDDDIYGDKGNDTLLGGSGSDNFIFGVSSGVDIISDFVIGQDIIKVNSAVASSASEVLSLVSSGGSGAIIDFDGGNTVTLTGISSDSLSVSDFLIF